VLAVAAAVLAVASSEAVFRHGKSRAYAAVSAAALSADCAAMAAAPKAYVSAGGESSFANNDPFVPPYTRSLRPVVVRVAPTGVWVMSTDLFSGVFEEGYFVPAAPLGATPQAYAAQKGTTVISSQPPVFRYGSR
jgi:hypothetical protein